ncbi:MAG: carbohydrate ABC transporter permease [Hungatella sp.]
MKKRTIKSWIISIGLLALVLVYLIPIMYLFMNSFKPYVEIMDSFIALPKQFTFENYEKAWKALNFVQSGWNSLLMTIYTIVILLITTTMAAYQISRTKTKLSNFLNQFFTVPYLIPFFAIMIPVLQMAKNLGISNHLLGVSLVNVGVSGSFGMVMFIGAIKGIPRELDEAASVDGCSKFGIYTKIILPLLKPAISSVTTVYALWTWNNFMLPFLLLTERSRQTLIIRVYDLFGMYGTDWEVVIASLILISAPIIILYAAFQKKITGGLTAGAVKG